MAKVSANYEVVYIIDPAQGEENTAALVAKFKTLAEQNGSAVPRSGPGNVSKRSGLRSRSGCRG